MEIRNRESVSILGPSGCGMSTLPRILAGLVGSEEGGIGTFGDRVKGPRDDVGVVLQSTNLLPWLSIEANLRLGLKTTSGKATARAAGDKWPAAFPVEATRAVQAQVPGSFLVEMQDTGHSLFYERPVEFNDSLLSLLQMAGFKGRRKSVHSNNAGYRPVVA